MARKPLKSGRHRAEKCAALLVVAVAQNTAMFRELLTKVNFTASVVGVWT
jgi:hypothetical protein